MPPTIDDFHWLVSPAAADTLRDAAERLASDGLVAAATALRKTLSPDCSQLVLQQCELRSRARTKFAHAERMFFTDVGLQQASGEAVASYKAARFPASAMAVDLCCGIGGDLLSLADRAPALGVDRDELTALFAAANCAATQRQTVKVRAADVTTLDFDDSSFVHIDPDRRAGRGRSTHIEMHEPNDAFLKSLLDRCAGGAIKLAPACELPADWQTRCTLEWISHNRECKQLVAWFGALAQPGIARLATLLRSDAPPATVSVGNETCTAAPTAEVVGRYVYEPDSAVIAAHLVDALAAKHGLLRIAKNVAYLTGDAPIDEPLLAGFEVMEVLPFDLKRLKAAVRAAGYGQITVKKRGVDVSPEELQRKLKGEGAQPATLLLTHHADRVVAIFAQRR